MRRYPQLLILALIWFVSSGSVLGSAHLYSKAVKYARAGQIHFAFMHYNNLLRNYPLSKYRKQALFATGEYYFQESGYNQATTAFETFLDENPDSEDRLYALAFLLNIAIDEKNELSVKGLEKQIIDLQQVSFVFRKTKEIAYRSPMYQNFKVIIHIKKIEFYLEGEFLAKVSY